MDRVAIAVASIHLAVLVTLMWTFRPQLGANVRVVSGMPTIHKACTSKGCDEGIRVGDTVLACAVNVFASSYSCPQRHHEDEPATAVFFTMRTLMSSIGVGNPTRVLMRLEQGGSVVYDRDPDSLDRSYVLGSMTTFLIFIVSAFAVTTFILRRRIGAIPA